MQNIKSAFSALTQSKKILVGFAALLTISCCVCSSCSWLTSLAANGNTTATATATSTSVVVQQQPTEQPTAQPTATTKPTATPRPKPTATPNPNAGLDAYRTAVMRNTTVIGNDSTNISTDCGNGDITACHDDLVTFDTDVLAFQQDIKNHPAPPCLKEADGDIQQGLNLYHQGAQLAISGIDQNDPSLIDPAGYGQDHSGHHLHPTGNGRRKECELLAMDDEFSTTVQTRKEEPDLRVGDTVIVSAAKGEDYILVIEYIDYVEFGIRYVEWDVSGIRMPLEVAA